MKLFAGIILILFSFWIICLDIAGNHGHFMFRPHMTEDWMIFGSSILSGGIGIWLLIDLFKKRNFK